MAEVPRGGEAGAGRVRKAVESFRPPLVGKYPKPINSGAVLTRLMSFSSLVYSATKDAARLFADREGSQMSREQRGSRVQSGYGEIPPGTGFLTE